MSVITDILGLKWLCNGDRKSALWLWLAFAVWFPYLLTGVILIVSFTVILIFPDTRKAVMGQKRMFRLSCAIGGLSAISALTAGNYLGILIALGIFVILICGCFLRATAERDIFNRACAILGLGSVAACISAVIQFEVIYNNPLYRVQREALPDIGRLFKQRSFGQRQIRALEIRVGELHRRAPARQGLFRASDGYISGD